MIPRETGDTLEPETIALLLNLNTPEPDGEDWKAQTAKSNYMVQPIILNGT